MMGSFGMYGWSNPQWRPQPTAMPQPPTYSGTQQAPRMPNQIIADNQAAEAAKEAAIVQRQAELREMPQSSSDQYAI